MYRLTEPTTATFNAKQGFARINLKAKIFSMGSICRKESQNTAAIDHNDVDDLRDGLMYVHITLTTKA